MPLPKGIYADPAMRAAWFEERQAILNEFDRHLAAGHSGRQAAQATGRPYNSLVVMRRSLQTMEARAARSTTINSLESRRAYRREYMRAYNRRLREIKQRQELARGSTETPNPELARPVSVMPLPRLLTAPQPRAKQGARIGASQSVPPSAQAIRKGVERLEAGVSPGESKGERIDLGLALLSIARPPDTRHETLTAHDIAAWCDCSPQAVQQIERRALRKLRGRLGERLQGEVEHLFGREAA